MKNIITNKYILVLVLLVIVVGSVTAGFMLGSNAAKGEIVKYLIDNNLEICLKESEFNYEDLDDFLANLNNTSTD